MISSSDIHCKRAVASVAALFVFGKYDKIIFSSQVGGSEGPGGGFASAKQDRTGARGGDGF